MLCRRVPNIGCTTALRPVRRISPVRIPRQQRVRIQPRAICTVEVILLIDRSARPVHKAGRLISRIVKQVHTQVVRQHAGNRLIFVTGQLTGQRHDQAQTRRIRTVLVGRVNSGGTAIEHRQAFQQIHRGKVSVQREHGTVFQVLRLTPSLLEPAAYKTANVLDSVLLAFRQFQILGQRFAGLRSGLNRIQKCAPLHGLVFPVRGGTGRTDRQRNRTIILHFHIIPP